MKSALIAFTLILGLGLNNLQAKTPYAQMKETEDAMSSGGKVYKSQVLQLLNLGTTGLQGDLASSAGLNISADRADFGEKQVNIAAIAAAALLMPKLDEGKALAQSFWSQKLGRTNIEDYEHDHVLMVSIIYDAASQYFAGNTTPVTRDVNAFLRKQDIKKFQTGCFQSSDDLVAFLNDSPGGMAGTSLTDLFGVIQKKYAALPMDNSDVLTAVNVAVLAAPATANPLPLKSAALVVMKAPGANGEVVVSTNPDSSLLPLPANFVGAPGAVVAKESAPVPAGTADSTPAKPSESAATSTAVKPATPTAAATPLSNDSSSASTQHGGTLTVGGSGPVTIDSAAAASGAGAAADKTTPKGTDKAKSAGWTWPWPFN